MAGLSAGARLIACVVTAGLIAAAWAAPAAAQAHSPALLDPIFQDHAVLQRDRPIAVWGEARPREQVTLRFNGATVRATADRAGAWRATLPATSAGGPYTLTAHARSGAEQTISDLLVGDVFLCSGQSNMEWPVSQALRANIEVQNAANDRLRLFQIGQAARSAPQADFATPPQWEVSSPDTIGRFSAACYFMARELQKTIDVPMGLIHASWGGSAIQTWVGASGLRPLPGYSAQLDLNALNARDPRAANQQMGASWEQWWRAAAPNAGEPWKPGAQADWRPLPEPMRDWKTWGVAETENLNGMVWFRRNVTLSPAQAAQASRLALGAIDEVDQTWVNGAVIANSFGWGAPRTYDLPAGALRAGENTIVVNVLSTWGAGGMTGPAEAMSLTFADGSSVPIGGDWAYATAPRGIGAPPRAPWEAVGGVSNLYNAMIAPIGPYGVRAVAWYQGESNTGHADQYQALLAAWMSSWRAQFGPDLSFLIVQLPEFGARNGAPVESGWAALRDAQRRAVAADARAGLAVGLGAGDAEDLHPQNKQAIGARLARAARHVVYGEAIAPSGPEVQSAARVGANIVVRFANVTDALVAYSARSPNAFELCGDSQASCRFVEAAINANDVVIADDGQPVTRVRYCWGDAPLCNLYDASGLPAGPFEMRLE